MKIDELNILLRKSSSSDRDFEGRALELKSATNNFSTHDLRDYCAALANEGGGILILGVSPNRGVCGTSVYSGKINTLENELFSVLGLRIDVFEIVHPNGRVLIFEIPSRPRGQVVRSKGKYTYPMRSGDSLSEMDLSTLKKYLNETDPDYSTDPILSYSTDLFDKIAINELRRLWLQKSRRNDIGGYGNIQLLNDLGLVIDDKATVASIILLGKKEQIARILPGAEIIFEWRQKPEKISYDYRKSWSDPFLLIHNDIWETVSARNIRFPFQEGFVQRDIWAFDEKSIREAILNAVTHREYRDMNRSIFIKASPEAFIIESPGGFLSPVNQDNILTSTAWRNRRLAEVFEKAGLVERSGQGVDDIYDKTIRDGKGAPDYSHSSDNSVVLNIPASIKDERFVLFLEKVANDKQVTLSPMEILELEKIRVEEVVGELRYKDKFVRSGLIEKVGGGRGSKYILSHRYYSYRGTPGVYTRLVGVSRDQKKILINNHLSNNKGGRLKDFLDVFPNMSEKDISNLLQEMKRGEEIVFEGSSKSGYWKNKRS